MDSIAVIIPVYNGAKYLAEALDCVVNQTLPPNEIIVIDDGSTDDSVEIARSYAGVQVVSQKNAGVSAARNRAASMTSATWIAYLDQDDLWHPRKLQRQLETLHQNPSADVCVTARYFLRHHGETAELSDIVSIPPSDQIAKSLYRTCQFTPSSVMIRRTALNAVGGYDTASQPVEDWDLWLRLDKAGSKFVSCPEPLATFRIHDSNTSNNGRRMYAGDVRVYELHIAPQVHPLLRPFHRLYKHSYLEAELAIMERGAGNPHLGIMASSLLRFPFGNWRRYKVGLHMLLSKLALIPKIHADRG